MTELTIGELAKKTGIRTDTVRYYETLKLIEPVGRTKAGYRLYDGDSVRRIDFIKKAKSLGFTLSEITTLLELQASQTATCQEMLDRTEAKIKEAKENIRYLNHIHTALEKLAESCPGGNMPLSECPILDYLNTQHKEGN